MSQQDRTTSGRRFVGPPIVSELYDDAEMAELIELFVSELPERGDKILKMLEIGDAMNLANEAHKLRGSSASHGFTVMGELAATIEETVRALQGEQLKDLSFIADQVHDLAGMCHRAVAQPTATGEGRAA